MISFFGGCKGSEGTKKQKQAYKAQQKSAKEADKLQKAEIKSHYDLQTKETQKRMKKSLKKAKKYNKKQRKKGSKLYCFVLLGFLSKPLLFRRNWGILNFNALPRKI